VGVQAQVKRQFRTADFGAQLVHKKQQMRSFGANENAVSHSEQIKMCEYEQGRMN
jgi:hypothetical protein